jgi:AcrR family transcriptional regulator
MHEESKPASVRSSNDERPPGASGETVQRRRRKESRPEEILIAALEEFAENGYAAARLDNVARRAGVAKGTIYLYFASKEKLFQAVVQQAVTPQLDEIEHLAQTHSGSVEDFLRGPFVMLQRQLLRSDLRRLLRVLLTEGLLFPELTEFYYKEVVSRGLAVIRTLIAQGVETGELRETSLVDLPQPLIAGALVALLWESLFGRLHPLDSDRLLETHLSVILDGLKTRPSSVTYH